MHHVLITYCTLKSIYFAEICDVVAIKLTYICSVSFIAATSQDLDSQGGGGNCAHVRCQFRKVSFLPVMASFKNRGRMETEPVVFFIGHYIHCKTISFLFNSVLYFPIIIIWSRKKKGNSCD